MCIYIYKQRQRQGGGNRRNRVNSQICLKSELPKTAAYVTLTIPICCLLRRETVKKVNSVLKSTNRFKTDIRPRITIIRSAEFIRRAPIAVSHRTPRSQT